MHVPDDRQVFLTSITDKECVFSFFVSRPETKKNDVTLIFISLRYHDGISNWCWQDGAFELNTINFILEWNSRTKQTKWTCSICLSVNSQYSLLIQVTKSGILNCPAIGQIRIPRFVRSKWSILQFWSSSVRKTVPLPSSIFNEHRIGHIHYLHVILSDIISTEVSDTFWSVGYVGSGPLQSFLS